MKKDVNAPVNSAVDRLRSCIIAMRTAAKAEQIDPEGPLGVWVQAQEAMLLSMADFAELQTDQIVERVLTVERGMGSAVERVEAEIKKLVATREEARQATFKIREEGNLLKEERLKAGDDLAIRMSDKIQQHLKSTILVRERRWNLRQNLRLVSIFAGVLFVVFLGGQWVAFHGDARAILERCQASPAIDPVSKLAYCPMWVVEGLPDPTPPAPARR